MQISTGLRDARLLFWSTICFAGLGANNLLLIIDDRRGAHPRNFLGLPSASVTPRDVASGIVAAIRAGWRPDVAGASFVFDSIDVAGVSHRLIVLDESLFVPVHHAETVRSPPLGEEDWTREVLEHSFGEVP